MERKGKGENMEERGERCELKKKKGGRGKYNDSEQYTPSKPSDSKEGVAFRGRLGVGLT